MTKIKFLVVTTRTVNNHSFSTFSSSLDCHIVEIDVKGPGEPGNEFSVQTIRRNPAATGAVTGSATYASFLSSLLGKPSDANHKFKIYVRTISYVVIAQQQVIYSPSEVLLSKTGDWMKIITRDLTI